MFTSHKQISPPSLVLKLKISEVSQKWIPKAVELKRIPTHKKCKCKKFCSQTRLVGEIYSSDVIMHRGYSTLMMRHYSQDLGSASDWSYRVGNLIQPIRSTTQISVVTRHQYGISALVSQTSFGGETSGNENNNLCKFWGSALRRIWT